MITKRDIKNGGFSLTELLVVMAIITMLSTASLPLATGLIRSNQVSRSIQTLQGLLDQARQQAIAQNTYVWVVIADPDPAAGYDQTSVAVIVSMTGGDVVSWSSDLIDLAGHQDLRLAGKIRDLPGVEIMNAGEVTFPGLLTEPSDAVNTFSDVQLQAPVAGKARSFTRAVQFSPTGEARVKTHGRLIELGVRPVLGGENSKNLAVMRLTAVSGKSVIYRPE